MASLPIYVEIKCSCCNSTLLIPSIIGGRLTRESLVFLFCDEACEYAYVLERKLETWLVPDFCLGISQMENILV